MRAGAAAGRKQPKTRGSMRVRTVPYRPPRESRPQLNAVWWAAAAELAQAYGISNEQGGKAVHIELVRHL